MDIKGIIELLKQEKYNEAKKNIQKNMKDEKNLEEFSKYYNILGIVELKKEKENSKSKAKEYFEESLNYKPIFKHSYYDYDEQEQDNNIAIGFLKQGLKEFPNDVELYHRLFLRENNKEKVNIINYFIDNNIIEQNIFSHFIEYAYSHKNYDLVILLVQKIENIIENKIDKCFYQLLGLSSEILLEEKIENIDTKKELVNETITLDIKNNLKYWHYLILLYLECIQNNVSNILDIIEKLPINAQLEDMYSWCDLLDVDFSNLYEKVFDKLEQKVMDKELAKLRILKNLYINNKINYGEEIIYKVKDIKKLISSLKYYPNEQEVYLLIFNAYINLNKYFDAFDFAIKSYLDNRIAKKVFSKKSFSLYFNEISKEDLIKVVNKLIIIKDNIGKYTISIDELLKDFFDEIIEKLFKMEMYDYIYRLIKDIKITNLIDITNIFEVAYSHKDKQISKKLYEHLLKKYPDNSAYNNNIGVIYKKEGNLFKAREYFEKARNNDFEDKISASNLQDINQQIQDLYEAYEQVQDENVWILSKLMLLYEQAQDDIITCSCKEQSKVLQTRPEKAQEIFENFIKNKYIVKIETNDDWGRNQYRINVLIRDFLRERKEYIESNKEYEFISSNINIDYLIKIGYTNELIKKIQNIDDIDVSEILLRDFKECAIAMASGQDKTAIVLSGSMTEALLNYKVQEKGIAKYKIIKEGEEKNVNIKDMGLADLLEVAKKENIIHQTDYHLTHFLRNYRNLIHPSVELRKKMEISKSESNLIWEILKKLIKDIL